MGSILCIPDKETYATDVITVNEGPPQSQTNTTIKNDKTETNIISINVKESTEQNQNIITHQNSFIFHGINVGMQLYCLDQFKSKYTGEILHKWRLANIVSIDDNGNVVIHFDGWSSYHDITLNLHDNISRLSPFGVLNEYQMNNGDFLTHDQLSVISTYFLTGEYPEEFTLNYISTQPNVNSPRLSTTDNNKTNKIETVYDSAPTHNPDRSKYAIGQQVRTYVQQYSSIYVDINNILCFRLIFKISLILKSTKER
jgi:hypothetical protein